MKVIYRTDPNSHNNKRKGERGAGDKNGPAKYTHEERK
jgi:hypothetical protein